MALRRLRLVQRRKALGLSQEALADRLGVERSTVVRWERAETEPQPWARPRIARMLQLSLAELAELLGDVADVPDRGDGFALVSSVPLDFSLSAEQTVKVLEGFSANYITSRREVLARLSVCTGSAVLQPVRRWVASLPWSEPGGAGVVEADEVAELEQAVAVFRRWDASGTGGLRRKAVVGQLNAVSETLRGPQAPPMRRRLFRITGELAQLAGWMAYDQGLFGAALLPARLARLPAGTCPDLGAKVVGDMTQLSTALGRYHGSLDLVRAALSGLPCHASPLVQAELLGLEARAYAQLGSRHALAAARSAAGCVEIYQEAAAGPVPDWLHYMTGAEVHCLAANTYIELALQANDPVRRASYAGQAETHTVQAREQRGEHFTRSRIFDQIRLAKVRLAQQEPAESAAAATGALELAEPTRSSLVVTWLICYHHQGA